MSNIINVLKRENKKIKQFVEIKYKIKAILRLGHFAEWAKISNNYNTG